MKGDLAGGMMTDDGADAVALRPRALSEDERLLSILSRYISRSTAKGLLERAKRSGGGEALADQLAKDAGLFTDEATQRKLAAELRGFSSSRAEGPVRAFVGCEVRREADLLKVRAAARELCASMSVRELLVQKIVTIVSELARNMISYAGGGQVTLFFRPADRSIVITAVDQGPGIANLDEILDGRYKSKTGLGLGILGAKRLSSELRVQSSPAGTTIEARVEVGRGG